MEWTNTIFYNFSLYQLFSKSIQKNLLHFISNENFYNSNSNMSALNFKRGFGRGNGSNSRKLSSFAEFWKGLGIIVGIWAVIFLL